MNIGDFSPDYPIFYEFLLANNALIPFLENCKPMLHARSDPINGAMHWSSTLQGHKYWEELHHSQPRVMISVVSFVKYCELVQDFTTQPYEFW